MTPCSQCGKPCASGICDKCNEKIARDMAKALRKELEERRKQESQDEKK